MENFSLAFMPEINMYHCVYSMRNVGKVCSTGNVFICCISFKLGISEVIRKQSNTSRHKKNPFLLMFDHLKLLQL